VTDIVFYSDGKALNGSWLTAKLKYDKQKAPLMGTWFGGYEGAPDKFLSFYFDGTFRYSYDPYDKDKYTPKEFSGEYDVSGNRVTFEVGGKKYSAKYLRDKKAKGHFLSLDGELPEDLKQQFRDVL
jgi:hypothetical protein